MPRTRLTPYPLLGLLAEGPHSGYDLRRAIDATFGHFWAESYGQIYPELRRLSAAGLVAAAPAARAQDSAAAAGRGGMPRNIFRLTEAGRAELETWVAGPAGRQVQRNEMLLKLYFAMARGSGDAARHVARRREELSRRLAILSRIEDRLRRLLPGAADLAGWLATVRHGVLLARAEMDWCDETAASLAGGGRPPGD